MAFWGYLGLSELNCLFNFVLFYDLYQLLFPKLKIELLVLIQDLKERGLKIRTTKTYEGIDFVDERNSLLDLARENVLSNLHPVVNKLLIEVNFQILVLFAL